jgi:hemerythrin
MPFMEWNDQLVTGIQEFDVDHHHLVALLNKAYDDFMLGVPNDSVLVILNELIVYASHHFVAEEIWMVNHSYPKLEAHKYEHDSFTKTVLELQDKFHHGNEHISLDTLTFLKKWVKNHLLETDVDYGKFNTEVVLKGISNVQL